MGNVPPATGFVVVSFPPNTRAPQVQLIQAAPPPDTQCRHPDQKQKRIGPCVEQAQLFPSTQIRADFRTIH
jgi:hypothetical protein